jgi:hypothetical protein
MIKKISCFACALFIFISNIASAEDLKTEETVKINDVLMVEHVANKIFTYASKNTIEVLKVEAEHDVFMVHCELMDVISDLYRDAISDTDGNIVQIIAKAKNMNDGTAIIIYVNKSTACVLSMLMRKTK